MFELIGVLIVLILIYIVVKDDGPRLTIWSYYVPGEIKWPKLWKRKKKK